MLAVVVYRWCRDSRSCGTFSVTLFMWNVTDIGPGICDEEEVKFRFREEGIVYLDIVPPGVPECGTYYLL